MAKEDFFLGVKICCFFARNMSIVSINDTDVAKITSGQVIVDLASVVKELVDNAIDAGSDKVEITFSDHGSKYVEVSDNGRGIDVSDFESLCLKHHTSKLTTFEDLASVATLGFRGEAMSSMCAVARVKVVTCSGSTFPNGSRLDYDSMGKITGKKTLLSGKKGTSVSVSELFQGMPVRQKNFAKHIKREYTRTLSLLQAYLLAYMHIRFTVFNISGTTGKKSMVMGTQGGESTLTDVLTTVYGRNGAYGLIPINISVTDIDVRFKLSTLGAPIGLSLHLTGVISDCSFGMGRAATDRQYFTINRRPVNHKKISRIVNEVYKSFNTTQCPVFVLDLHVDSSLIDVNVTPDKRLVMMQCEDVICEVIREELSSLYKGRNNFLPKSQVGVVNIGSQPLVSSQNRALDRFRSLQTTFDNSQAKDSDNDVEETSIPESNLEVKQIFLDAKEDTILENSAPIVEYPENFEVRLVEPVDLEYFEVEDVLPDKDLSLQSEGKDMDEEHKEIDDFGDIDGEDLSFSSPLKTSVIREDSNLRLETALFVSSEAETPGTPNRESRKLSPASHSVNQEATSSEVSRPSQDAVAEDSDDDSYCTSKSFDDYQVAQNDQIDQIDQIIPESVLPEEVETKKPPTTVPESTDRSLGDQLQGILHPIRVTIADAKMYSACAFELQKPTSTLASIQNISEAMEIRKEDFTKMEIVGQFNSGFIIVTYGNKLFIVDQHALDEIYNYERLMNDLTLEPQPLVAPQVLELSPIDEMKILEYADHLWKNGFAIEEIEDAAPGCRLKLLGIPVLKNIVFDVSDLHELAHKLHEQGAGIKARSTVKLNGMGTMMRSALPTCRCTKVDRMIALRACRLSIMIGLVLSKHTMSKIVKNLAGLDRPWNCPHGRPTMRHLADIQATGFSEDYEL